MSKFKEIKWWASLISGCIALLLVIVYIIWKNPILGIAFLCLAGFLVWAIIESRRTKWKKGKKDNV